jgi:hypothetical protein
MTQPRRGLQTSRRWSGWRIFWTVIAFLSLLMAGVAYVNGRWFDGELRAPSARTPGGALLMGVAQGGVFVLFALLLVSFGRRDSRRPPRAGQLFDIVGFADADSYKLRTPAWTTEGVRGLDAAQAEARRWLDDQGDDARVEIVEDRRGVGHVVMYLDRNEVQTI